MQRSTHRQATREKCDIS